MGADRARVSYNPRQQYRSVVMQQGRVTLEADWNESQAIVGEELRHETLDIIGPAGTPDNGYDIVVTGTVPTPPFDFTVSAGTMYVGGVRLVLDAAVQYSNQSDWLDHSGDPDWIMPSSPTDEYIYLLVREQEVSAVEDSALREVALGGPDTAARTRMIQHIVRLGTQTTNCAGGLAAAETYWANEGLIFDPATMRLEPQSSLQVSFGSLPPPDPCEPEVTGGYLGADNQLIRVQITGQNTLVWGFDDASFLYRVTIDSTAQVLTLQSQPVDAFHQPQANQAVEVLQSAALLNDGEYIASATGVVQTLTSSYNQSTQQLTLPAALPAPYIDPAQTPRAFLRVWQQQLTFTPGTPIQLGNTGVYVTLTTAGGAPFHSGDYWMIAVRPSTPTQVYPQSYLQGKGPDGPRMWACPLAAIEWDAGILQRDEDCRQQFCNLVEACNEGRGCCTVTVRPQDLIEGNSLQTILDSLSKSKFLAVRVCLTPGAYHLPAPLMIRHANLTLDGCPGGAVLLAQPGLENNFLDGLVVIANIANVTIQGLQMVLPNVPFSAAKGQLAGLDPTTLQNLGGPALTTLQNLNVSIGIRALACRGLSVRDCIFFYRPPEAPSNNFAVGILASSVCSDLTISGNRFEGPGGQMELSAEPFTYLAGFMSAPVTALTSVSRVAPPPPPPVPAPAAAATLVGQATKPVQSPSIDMAIFRIPWELTGTVVWSSLEGARFRDNLFTGLSAAVVVYSDAEDVIIQDNTVQSCYSGFHIFGRRTPPSLQDFGEIPQTTQELLQSILEDPVLELGSTTARSYPISAALLGLLAPGMTISLSSPVPVFPVPGFPNNPLLNTFDILLQLDAAMESAAAPQIPETQPTFSLHCSDNNVSDPLVDPNLTSSGAALIIWGAQQLSDDAIVSSNRLTCNSSLPVATVSLMTFATVNANLILNVSPDTQAWSLFISGGATAVAGNVLAGNENLAANWAQLNQLLTG